MSDKVTWKHLSGRRGRRFFHGIVVLRISNKYSLSITSLFGIYNGRSLKYIFCVSAAAFYSILKDWDLCTWKMSIFTCCLLCLAFYWVILTLWIDISLFRWSVLLNGCLASGKVQPNIMPDYWGSLIFYFGTFMNKGSARSVVVLLITSVKGAFPCVKPFKRYRHTSNQTIVPTIVTIVRFEHR